MAVDWSKVDWFDVAFHALAAAGIVGGVWGAVLFLAPELAPVVAWVMAVVNVAVWYGHEASQHVERGPDPAAWGWGSQMEFYVPAAVGLTIAVIATIWG